MEDAEAFDFLFICLISQSVRVTAVALDAVARRLCDTEGFIVYSILYLSV
jgi:hypothetical protein